MQNAGLGAGANYSPQQQALMAAIQQGIGALPGPGGALGSVLGNPPAPTSGGVTLGSTPSTGPNGSFLPPAMTTFAPTGPEQGPSYGWDFPSVAGVPPAKPLPSSPSSGAGSSGSDAGNSGENIQGGDKGPKSRAHGGAIRRADGGQTGAEIPYFARREASEVFHPGGLINSSVAGRTDRIPLSVAAGSYIIPADVVSGLGEGNTLAGAKVMDMIMHSGPHGTRNLEPRGGGRGIPAPPARASVMGTQNFARGGRGKTVKIIAAGGEYVVHPRDVAKWSKTGNLKDGHDALDRFVTAAREHVVRKTKMLPGPKK